MKYQNGSKITGIAIAILVVLIISQPIIEVFNLLQTWKNLVPLVSEIHNNLRPGFSLFPCDQEYPLSEQAKSLLKARLMAHESARLTDLTFDSVDRLAVQSYCLIEDYSKALATINQPRSSSVSDPLPFLQSMALYRLAGNDQSIANILKSGQLSADDLSLGIETLIRLERWENAEDWLEWSVELYPRDSALWSLWLDIGKKHEGRNDWARASSLYEAGIAAQERLGVDLIRGSFYLRLGLCLNRQPYSRQFAINSYNLAVKSNTFLSANELALAYESRAKWYRSFQPVYSPEIYIPDLLKSLEINPKSADTAFTLGVVYLWDVKDPEKAVEYFKYALAIFPDYVEIYVSLGDALTMKGDIQGAVAAYQKALEYRPGWEEARKRLNESLEKLEDSGKP